MTKTEVMKRDNYSITDGNEIIEKCYFQQGTF